MQTPDLDVSSLESSDPDVVRETARQVLSRPHFQFEPTPDSGEGLVELLWRFLMWLSAPLRALFDVLDGISPLLAWAVILLLVLLLIALIGHIAYTFKVALDRRIEVKHIDLRAAEKHRDPAELERLADAASGAQNHSQAARLLLLASLLRLELAQDRPFRRGTTNREHLRRYHGSPIFEPLRFIVDLIDRSWYGNEVCLAEHVAQCRQAYTSICQAIKEPTLDYRT